MSRRRLRIAVAAALLSLACVACGEPDPPVSDHSLPPLLFEVDPDPDPAVKAWAGCLETVTQCLEGGRSVRECGTARACGADCAAALDRALVGAEGREAELDAFESVFINPGAVCRPGPRAAS